MSVGIYKSEDNKYASSTFHQRSFVFILYLSFNTPSPIHPNSNTVRPSVLSSPPENSLIPFSPFSDSLQPLPPPNLCIQRRVVTTLSFLLLLSTPSSAFSRVIHTHTEQQPMNPCPTPRLLKRPQRIPDLSRRRQRRRRQRSPRDQDPRANGEDLGLRRPA